MINMAISVATAPRMFQMTKSVKDTRYIVRRPTVSENDDHQSGPTDMASIYIATDRFVIDGSVCRSTAMS